MSDRDPTIRLTMLPRDTNSNGTIFGGIILSYIDLAGAAAAKRYRPRKYATRAMKEVEFLAPVYVGDNVSFYAEVIRVGRTSITIRVEVEAERFDEADTIVPVTAAEVTYVAIDEHGAARTID